MYKSRVVTFFKWYYEPFRNLLHSLVRTLIWMTKLAKRLIHVLNRYNVNFHMKTISPWTQDVIWSYKRLWKTSWTFSESFLSVQIMSWVQGVVAILNKVKETFKEAIFKETLQNHWCSEIQVKYLNELPTFEPIWKTH